MRTALRWRWAGMGLIVALLGVFSWLNSGESVALHFGLFVIYQAPVVTVFYIAFLLGMSTMFLLGLRHDLRVRQFLRERGLLERSDDPGNAGPPPPPPDHPM